MLEDALDRHLALAGEDIQRHVDHQQLAWQRSVASQRLDLLRRQVALDHTDPALLEGYARAGENAALDQARIDGLPADSDEARQLATQARSSLYRSAIEGALAAGDHATASTLHEHASDRLAPADARSLEPELRLSRELQTARAWLAELAPPPSPEPAAFFDAPRLLDEADAAHAAATAQNEADWSGDPTQRATNQHLIDVQFGKQKRVIEQTRVRLDATVQDWLARPGADGEAQTERPPFAVWKQLGPEQQQSIDIVLAQNARGPGVTAPTDPSPGVSGYNSPERHVAEPPPRRGVAPNVEPPPNSSELEEAFKGWEGRLVRLPDGSPIPDPRSPNGFLMSPFGDLSDVAKAGRRAGARYRSLLLRLGPSVAHGYLAEALGEALRHGGTFDYQRRRYEFGRDGFSQLRQFRNVSNFNVGLFCQQAGLAPRETLVISGIFALKNSSNTGLAKDYFLDPTTKYFIELGHLVGQSGAFKQ